MYKRRLKGYASVGYKIQQSDSKDLFGVGQSAIFTGKNYQDSFFADLLNASKSIIISATKLWFAKRVPILELLAELLHEVWKLLCSRANFQIRIRCY
jgi:RecA-family ATPase